VPDLIKNKKYVGRPQDLLDVAKLEALLPKRRSSKRSAASKAKRR
jgi:hypothetical protein